MTEPTHDVLSLAEMFLIGLGAVAGLAFGFLLGRMGRSRLTSESTQLTAEIARSEAQNREFARQVSRLRNEQRWLSNLSRYLPNVMRDLNSSMLDPRQIPPLLFSLVDALFEPDQIALFSVRSKHGDETAPVELCLSDQRGLPDSPGIPRRIRIGEGKIGWVGENKVEMLAEDWMNLTRTEGRAIEDHHPALRLDMIGPIVHHQDGAEKLLGVLVIGGVSVRPRDEKMMLQMVTNLASIALVNSDYHRRLTEQANHDGLTGLLNKRFFMKERLGLLINAAEKEGQRLSLFIFDIDYFKRYNDTNGHVAGDEVLKSVAKVLRDNIRPGDVACRYGGEEFIVAMPRTTGADALAVAERVRKAMQNHPFPLRETQPLNAVTISGGVAEFPVDGTNGTDLIRNADEALYRAKSAGRNRVVQYRGVDFSGPSEDGAGTDWPSQAADGVPER